MSFTNDMIYNLGTLPKEIKEVILSFIPIDILIKVDKSICDYFIKKYIKNNLLSNMYQSGFILTLPNYSEIFETKLKQLSLSYAQSFINYVDKYSVGKAINMFDYFDSPITIVSFEIIYKFIKVGPLYKGKITNHRFLLTNAGLMNNSCASYYFDKLASIKYDELSLSNHIYNLFLMEMNYSDTVTHMISMKITKTFYPTGINSNYKEDTLIVYK